MENKSVQESDLLFTIRQFQAALGYVPNLTDPKTFNEHLNYNKLWRHHDLLTILADKYAVRDYVAERVGSGYLTELYFVTHDPTTIDLDTLPTGFVVKANHGSSMTLVVKDKSTIKRNMLLHLCRVWLEIDYSAYGGEKCYKEIPRRIVIEELLESDLGDVPTDYKFLCFHGEPKVIQVDINRHSNHQRNLYNTDWNRLPVQYIYPNFEQQLPPPTCFEEMLDVARRLARGLDFVRVDLYQVGKRVIFGEMTNYPQAGFGKFEPQEYDLLLGTYWS